MKVAKFLSKKKTIASENSQWPDFSSSKKDAILKGRSPPNNMAGKN